MAKHIDRRKFLGSLPCMALGTTTLYSSLVNLKAMEKIMASTSMGPAGEDYKAMVCILLNGGNDSYNMVVPRSGESYTEYSTVRGNMALDSSDLLPIDVSNGDGRDFGLHPSLTNLKSIFDSGNLAFVNNIGTLVEPVTKTTLNNKSANVPLGLLSHIDQVMHWQTAVPQDRLAMGWGGKMADLLKSMNTSDDVSMNISLSGNNIFQRGEDVVPYAINNDGAVAIYGLDIPHPFFQMVREDVTDMMNKNYEDIFKEAYAGILRRSVDSNDIFNAAIANTTDFAGTFTQGNRLSQDLRMVAQTISARETLGAKRQIFFVEIGGFDNHDELIENHAGLMTSIDLAMSEFYAASQAMGISDCITTFTISDFARTLTSNGNGTDHAWGGNAIVMGGAVNGQKFYGDYPVLGLNSDLELGGGILYPTRSADEYFAEIALWFGISPNDLSLILPNIGNFYDVGSSEGPFGFLS